MLKSITKLIAVFALSCFIFACGGGEDKGVYFVNINDGDTLTSPFKVEMGVTGMEVEPAGAVNEGKGHHHLIIDGSWLEVGEVVPADEKNIHYGGGQTITDDITLEPGTHTLTLQFADGFHASYGEEMSKTITVTVE